MVRLILPPLLGLSLVLLSSCGSPYRNIKTRSVTEAQLLQADLSARGIAGEEKESGDTMLEEALKLGASGKDRDASMRAEMAAARYRLVLTRLDLTKSGVELKEATTSLQAAQEQVNMYERILDDIRSSRKP